jgi:GNAT superfamily N-acetyltransferase
MNLTVSSDLTALEEIEAECDEYFKFDPTIAAAHNRPLRECLSMGDIIPGVTERNYIRENYKLYCIRKDNVIVGWLSFYLEYQETETVYLSVLYIKEIYRKNGIGTEILEVLVSNLAAGGFKKICLHCSLRNATALSFWVKSGFNHIVDIECDGNLFPGNFGGIELMKLIT